MAIYKGVTVTPMEDDHMMDMMTVIALLAVVIIGLPHGAMDGAVAISMGYGQSIWHMVRFLVVYIGIAVMVVMVWLWLPPYSLFAFLLLSIWHFGRGDSLSDLPPLPRYIQTISHGGLVVLGISQCDKTMADQVFQWLVFGDTAMLWVWIDVATWIWIPVAAIYICLGVMDNRLYGRIAEWLVLAVMVYTLPALVAFAVYFCLIHTIRHMYRVVMMLRHMLALRMAVGLTVLFTLASWAGGGLVYMALLPSQGAMPASMMVVFIGLAALTVPHSLLIDSLFRPRFEYDAQEQNTSHNPIEGRHV